MLSVSERDLDRNLFALTDTALPGAANADGAGAAADAVIDPAFPWSIAVPIKRHHITVLHAGAAPAAAAAPTGIGQMEIGSTFIIGAKRNEK
jgi:hypothetical protein